MGNFNWGTARVGNDGITRGSTRQLGAGQPDNRDGGVLLKGARPMGDAADVSLGTVGWFHGGKRSTLPSENAGNRVEFVSDDAAASSDITDTRSGTDAGRRPDAHAGRLTSHEDGRPADTEDSGRRTDTDER